MSGKTDEALATLLADTRGELRTVRFEAAGGRPKDPNAPRKLRKVIARVLTEQGRRLKSASRPHASGHAPA